MPLNVQNWVCKYEVFRGQGGDVREIPVWLSQNWSELVRWWWDKRVHTCSKKLVTQFIKKPIVLANRILTRAMFSPQVSTL